MIHQLWWIPCVAFWYSVCAWLSVQSHELHGKWTWYLWVWGAICPLWVIVTRITTNITFDSLLYDIALFLSFTITLIFMGSESFSLLQKIGAVVAIIGVVLFRLG